MNHLFSQRVEKQLNWLFKVIKSNHIFPARTITFFFPLQGETDKTYDSNVITSVFGLSPDEKHILICQNKVNLTKAAIICATRIFVGEQSFSLLYDRNTDLHHTVIQFGFKIRKLQRGL